jgi:hypothetical protein
MHPLVSAGVLEQLVEPSHVGVEPVDFVVGDGAGVRDGLLAEFLDPRFVDEGEEPDRSGADREGVVARSIISAEQLACERVELTVPRLIDLRRRGFSRRERLRNGCLARHAAIDEPPESDRAGDFDRAPIADSGGVDDRVADLRPSLGLVGLALTEPCRRREAVGAIAAWLGDGVVGVGRRVAGVLGCPSDGRDLQVGLEERGSRPDGVDRVGGLARGRDARDGVVVTHAVRGAGVGVARGGDVFYEPDGCSTGQTRERLGIAVDGVVPEHTRWGVDRHPCQASGRVAGEDPESRGMREADRRVLGQIECGEEVADLSCGRVAVSVWDRPGRAHR